MSDFAFISYGRGDAAFAKRLGVDLKGKGVDIWLDQLDIQAGERWDRAVEEALDSCSQLIVVLTPEAAASENVMDEVSFALQRGTVVIPVLAEPCDIPLRLQRLQYLDFTQDHETALRRLVDQLHDGSANEAETKHAAGVAEERPIGLTTRVGWHKRGVRAIIAAAAVFIAAIVIVQVAQRNGSATGPLEAVPTEPVQPDLGAAAVTNWERQASFGGDCRTRPPGTFCALFEDNYAWLVEHAIQGWETRVESGRRIQAAITSAGRYEHVLGTDSVRVR